MYTYYGEDGLILVKKIITPKSNGQLNGLFIYKIRNDRVSSVIENIYQGETFTVDGKSWVLDRDASIENGDDGFSTITKTCVAKPTGESIISKMAYNVTLDDFIPKLSISRQLPSCLFADSIVTKTIPVQKENCTVMELKNEEEDRSIPAAPAGLTVRLLNGNDFTYMYPTDIAPYLNPDTYSGNYNARLPDIKIKLSALRKKQIAGPIYEYEATYETSISLDFGLFVFRTNYENC